MATEVQEYQLVTDLESLKAESHFPGISYDDFDRGGNICPWKICRMFEAGRAIPILIGNFLNISEATDNKARFFVLGGDYYFDSALWDAARKHTYFPYKVTFELISVGDTSLTYRQVLTNKFDNKELATHYLKMVLVNMETRRPTALPPLIREKFQPQQGKFEGEAKILVNTVKSVPEGAFQAETLVQPSDTDFNGHTNQGSYVRFCLDAAEAANRAGALECLEGDICRYPILKISISYKGETGPGDRLMTSVWQDELSPQMLHFATFRQGKPALIASITFKTRPRSKL